MKLKNIGKKFISLLVFFSVVFASFGLIIPKTTLAGGVPVIDITHIGTTILQTVKDYLLHESSDYRELLRDIITRQLLRKMVNQTIEWVQGDGEPKFVSNWEDYSNSAFSQGANETFEEIPADYICPEFRDDLQRMLGVHFSDNPRPNKSGWTESLKCTSGEDDYSFADPQNNLYGAYTMIQNQMAYQGTLKEQAAKNEAIAGKGYISPKKCLESDDFGRCLQEIITTPGASVADVIERVLTSNIEFMSNVQSPFTTLVNALVSRLINTGLKEIGLSTMPGGKTYGYQDTAYSGAVEQDLEFQKQTIISTYQRFLNEKQSVLSIKKQSLEIANQIASSTCPAAGDIQGKINTLNSEITGLESIINRLNNLIAGARSGTAEYYAEQMPIVSRLYQEFMTQYGEQIYQDIYTGNARTAAQQELQELRRIQQQCLIKV